MSTIHLHKDVLRHIGKSHVYARARQYADANGLLEKTVIDDDLKCETFRLPDGSSWAFIEPVTNEEHEAMKEQCVPCAQYGKQVVPATTSRMAYGVRTPCCDECGRQYDALRRADLEIS